MIITENNMSTVGDYGNEFGYTYYDQWYALIDYPKLDFRKGIVTCRQ